MVRTSVKHIFEGDEGACWYCDVPAHEHPSVLTVKQLITILQAVDPDKKIRLEGCDCSGLLIGVNDEGENVLLEREH